MLTSKNKPPRGLILVEIACVKSQQTKIENHPLNLVESERKNE